MEKNNDNNEFRNREKEGDNTFEILSSLKIDDDLRTTDFVWPSHL